MEYTVAKSEDLLDLESEVADLIADGWTPLGGVATMDCGDVIDGVTYRQVYLQAMTKTTP